MLLGICSFPLLIFVPLFLTPSITCDLPHALVLVLAFRVTLAFALAT